MPQSLSEPGDARRALAAVSQQRASSSRAQHCGGQDSNILQPDYAATPAEKDDPLPISAPEP
jgi:hypothetical protein